MYCLVHSAHVEAVAKTSFNWQRVLKVKGAKNEYKSISHVGR
jgi:hypothetical protein